MGELEESQFSHLTARRTQESEEGQGNRENKEPAGEIDVLTHVAEPRILEPNRGNQAAALEQMVSLPNASTMYANEDLNHRENDEEQEVAFGSSSNIDILAGIASFSRIEVKFPQLYVTQLPVDTMKDLMETYGPERCSERVPKNGWSDNPKSIQRKFMRWFPNFHKHFFIDSANGEPRPRLGVEGEKARRKVEQLRAKKERSKIRLARKESRRLLRQARTTNQYHGM
jgi:hypothetical protein